MGFQYPSTKLKVKSYNNSGKKRYLDYIPLFLCQLSLPWLSAEVDVLPCRRMWADPWSYARVAGALQAWQLQGTVEVNVQKQISVLPMQRESLMS